MEIKEIQSYLDETFPEVKWRVYSNRCVWKSSLREHAGMLLQYGLKAKRQINALAHLLLRTYEYRKPSSVAGNYIAGDLSYRSQEELHTVMRAG